MQEWSIVPGSKHEGATLFASPSQLAEVMAKAGAEAVFVDMTRPDIGLPVIRAFAPGLLSHRRRLGGLRLYQVPVRMGWTRDVNEGAANSAPVPLI
jgi:ribosomal protein S12 methylthiotransferase accessory factor